MRKTIEPTYKGEKYVNFILPIDFFLAGTYAKKCVSYILLVLPIYLLPTRRTIETDYKAKNMLNIIFVIVFFARATTAIKNHLKEKKIVLSMIIFKRGRQLTHKKKKYEKDMILLFCSNFLIPEMRNMV